MTGDLGNSNHRSETPNQVHPRQVAEQSFGTNPKGLHRRAFLAAGAPGKQLDRAIELARKISAAAPLEPPWIRLSEGQEAAYAGLFPELAHLAQSDDHEEYFRAQREKRAPIFRGR